MHVEYIGLSKERRRNSILKVRFLGKNNENITEKFSVGVDFLDPAVSRKIHPGRFLERMQDDFIHVEADSEEQRREVMSAIKQLAMDIIRQKKVLPNSRALGDADGLKLHKITLAERAQGTPQLRIQLSLNGRREEICQSLGTKPLPESHCQSLKAAIRSNLAGISPSNLDDVRESVSAACDDFLGNLPASLRRDSNPSSSLDAVIVAATPLRVGPLQIFGPYLAEDDHGMVTCTLRVGQSEKSMQAFKTYTRQVGIARRDLGDASHAKICAYRANMLKDSLFGLLGETMQEYSPTHRFTTALNKANGSHLREARDQALFDKIGEALPSFSSINPAPASREGSHGGIRRD